MRYPFDSSCSDLKGGFEQWIRIQASRNGTNILGALVVHGNGALFI